MVDVPPEPDQHKKQCTTCSELIAASALKCIHCDSYQDWRRYLAFSSTVLALLVALLSVATVAGPVFRDLLTTKDSDLAVGSFQGFNDDGEAMFVVTNSGNRPGTVADAYVLIAPLDKPNESIYFTGFPRGKLSSEESFFVDGGKSKLVRFRARPWRLPPAAICPVYGTSFETTRARRMLRRFSAAVATSREGHRQHARHGVFTRCWMASAQDPQRQQQQAEK